MNIGSLRKRLARLEKITKAQNEQAALASAPARERSQEDGERGVLGILGLVPASCRTAEAKTEIERLGALYPDELECLRAFDEAQEGKTLEQLVAEYIEDIKNEKWN
jgi:hypothetical protein